MKVAVVAGGWHWPAHFFREMARAAAGADLFVVAHRSPELPIVREEKRAILENASGQLADIDRVLYAEYPDVAELLALGWRYREEPNTIGDWGFFNQWLTRVDFHEYDVILNCHDDTFIRRHDLDRAIAGDWILLANGKYPEAPPGYVRGSFEFWRPELLDMLGGRIDVGDIRMTREGKTDSPANFNALSDWNDICVPMRDFMVNAGLENQIGYLSPFYRISPWAIEGERGFMHSRVGAPWSFDEGLREFPLESAA